MADGLGGQLLLQAALIGVNAFFASAEMSVVSLNTTLLRKKAEDGDKKAEKLLSLIENPSAFLSAIQIAITLAGFMGAAFSADVLSEKLVYIFRDWGWDWGYTTMNTICVILITIIISFFPLIFGELVPKRIAQQKSVGWAKMSVGILNFISKLFRPVIWLLSASTNIFVPPLL